MRRNKRPGPSPPCKQAGEAGELAEAQHHAPRRHVRDVAAAVERQQVGHRRGGELDVAHLHNNMPEVGFCGWTHVPWCSEAVTAASQVVK